MRAVLAQLRFDIRVWWRNGEQLLLMLILPALAIVMGGRNLQRLGIDERTLLEGTVTLALFGSGFVGQSILTAFDRRANALIVLGAGPLGRLGFVLARSAATVVTAVVQAIVLAVVAVIVGLDAATLLRAATIGLLAVPAFVGWGLVLAGTVRAELVLGIANLVFVLAALFGGAYAVQAWSPLGAVRILQYGDAVGLVVLAVWTVAGITCTRWFKWID